MKTLRWLLLLIYLMLVVWFWMLLAISGGSEGGVVSMILLLSVFILQPLFFAIRGNPQSLEPVAPRHIVLPAIISGLMLAILLGTMVFAVIELLDWRHELVLVLPLVGAALSWGVWLVLFFAVWTRLDYLRAVRRMVLTLIGGSLLQLLVTVPSHLVVIRRPGCFVGVFAMLGIAGGVGVLFWAFGPGIVLLFLCEGRKQMAGHCPGCGYNLYKLTQLRCPECGRRFTLREVRMTEDQLDLH